MEINAMIHSFYGLTLVFFNEDDINYEDKTVVGRYYTVDGWKSKEVALPKIINNMRIKKPKEKSKVYTFLDKNSYLLFHNFGSKRYVENLLLENKLLEDLIIPSKCILQLKSLEKCKEKFRTLPALNFDVTNDLIKHFSRGNYHQ